jgi:hypothetical protein
MTRKRTTVITIETDEVVIRRFPGVIRTRPGQTEECPSPETSGSPSGPSNKSGDKTMFTQIKNSTVVMMAAAAAFSTGLAGRADACQYSNRPVLASVTEVALKPRLLRPLPAPGEAARAGDGSDASVVGLWKITILVNRQPVDEAFEVWHSDGTEMLIDQTPPVMGNVCLGTYEQTGLRVYVLTHPFWVFDSTGNLTGSGLISSTVMLAKDGATFSGSSTEDTFDLKGKQLSHTTAQVEGVRIRP